MAASRTALRGRELLALAIAGRALRAKYRKPRILPVPNFHSDLLPAVLPEVSFTREKLGSGARERSYLRLKTVMSSGNGPRGRFVVDGRERERERSAVLRQSQADFSEHFLLDRNETKKNYGLSLLMAFLLFKSQTVRLEKKDERNRVGNGVDIGPQIRGKVVILSG